MPLAIFANVDPIKLPQDCTKKCATPFGEALGGRDLLTGFSNCTPECESDNWQMIHLSRGQVVKTGMKWQCVEYSRRWLNVQLNYTFESIDHAYQIWKLEKATEITTQKQRDWLKFENGKTNIKPQRHDLLIYNQEQGPHGHVAVIVGIKGDFALIAEQNYSNEKWENTDFARKIKLIKNKESNYVLKDKGVIGWMRIDVTSLDSGFQSF